MCGCRDDARPAVRDETLTGAWRGSKGFWSSGPSAADRFELEHLEHVDDLDDLPSPDHQRF